MVAAMTQGGIGPESAGRSWLRILRIYLAIIVSASLAWEIAQLPLYMIWQEGSVAEILFAVLHCTLGDGVIAAACLMVALIVAGSDRWPRDCRNYRAVAVLAVTFGIAYTIYSEWLNVQILGTWQYRSAMPVLPPLRTGLAPLLQWIVIPPLAFRFAWRRRAVYA